MIMEKKKYLLLIIVLFLTLTVKVKALSCSAERTLKLVSLANNVKVTYQKYDKPSEDPAPEDYDMEPDTFPAFKIVIYNLPDDLNVSVKKVETGRSVTRTSADKAEDGAIYVDAGYAYSVQEFKVLLKAQDLECHNQTIKSMTLTLPMFNRWSIYEPCQKNPEHALCQEFSNIDYSDLTIDTVFERLEEDQQQKMEESEKNSFAKYTPILIIIGGLIIAIIVVYVIKRKRSEKTL